MQSLFARTFVSSCLAAAIVAVGFTLIYVGQNDDPYWQDWYALHRDAFAPRMHQALAAMDAAGAEDVDLLVEDLMERAVDYRVYAVTASNHPRADLPIDVQNIGELAVLRGTLVEDLGEEKAYIAMPLPHRFPGTALVGELERPSMLFWYVDPQTLPLRSLLLLTVLAVFCYRISKPLSRRLQLIREQSRQIAAGNLSATIGRHLGEPTDEASALAHDFEHMADRVRELLISQRRLQQEQLEELRTPLVALLAALELDAKCGEGLSPSSVRRVAREARRLEALLEQGLNRTKSPLDAPDRLPPALLHATESA